MIVAAARYPLDNKWETCTERKCRTVDDFPCCVVSCFTDGNPRCGKRFTSCGTDRFEEVGPISKA